MKLTFFRVRCWLNNGRKHGGGKQGGKNALQKDERNLGYIYSWLSVNHGKMASKENRRYSFHGVVQKQHSLWK